MVFANSILPTSVSTTSKKQWARRYRMRYLLEQSPEKSFSFKQNSHIRGVKTTAYLMTSIPMSALRYANPY